MHNAILSRSLLLQREAMAVPGPAPSELKAQAVAHLETYHLKDALACDPLHEKDPKEAELQGHRSS